MAAKKKASAASCGMPGCLYDNETMLALNRLKEPQR
jgi:hypothetical protein